MIWCSLALVLTLQEAEPDERRAVRDRLKAILERETDRGETNPEFEEWKRRWTERQDEPDNVDVDRASPVGIPPGLSQAIFYLVLALCAAAVLALVAYAIASWRREKPPPREEIGTSRVLAAPTQFDALKKGPDEWLVEARKWAARGEHRTALRFLLLATLARLHRARQIDYEQSKTNRECLATYRGQPALRPNFASIVRLFEHAWYGRVAVSERDYAGAEEMALALGQGAVHE